MRFLPIIDIDLSKNGEQIIRLTGANRLWLPPKLLRYANGVPTLVTQDANAVVAIRFEQTNEQIPFGVGESLANSLSGDFDTVYATVIAAGAGGHLYLLAGQDVAVNYGNASGLSPIVSGLPTASTPMSPRFGYYGPVGGGGLGGGVGGGPIQF